ncbi:MAG: leucine--tRNA ligase [Candidatus Micrarchaeota archaeon]
MTLDFSGMEAKWQKEWDQNRVSKANAQKGKPKFFLIFAYPGMSGFLHVGHMRGFTYSDVITRFKRMQGYNVLFPAGFHASGLPAISYATKVRKKDPSTIEQLKAYGLNSNQIAELEKPENVVAFFSKVYVNDFWKPFGFLIDWNRGISTIAPEYQKFIEWQFKKLKQNNLLVQKPHYAPQCPVDGPVAIDTSETDISSGGNAQTLEYTLLKFKYDSYVLPAATLRPETIFGVTNFWLNPETTLIECEYQNQKWLVTKEAANKIAYQKPEFQIKTKTIPAKELIGKTVTNPATNQKIIILPAFFVDAGTGTGIVMSVPSHAPFDWIALFELQQKPEQLKKFGIDQKQLDSIRPISLINTAGYGPHAAIEECQKRGIVSLSQEKELEEATKAVYAAEFHAGKLNAIYKELQGTTVSQAKDKIIESFKRQKICDDLLGFSEKVICRCGTEVVFKHIPDQWFIRYSDETLTQKTKDHVSGMTVVPEQYKTELPAILDWFSDRACVRQGNWLGTRFPFDNKWIIEPISDSTLYPLTYLFSNYVKEKKLSEKNLTEEFFDFVFLEKGKSGDAAKKSGISEALLEQIRSDVQYWYPLDINLGGKEHKTVHFPVFLMNHCGILPQKYWPKGIFVNWWVTGEIGKISKSKGGANSLHDLTTRFSVDALRLYYCNIGNPHLDIQFSEETAQKYKNTLERNQQIIEKSLSSKTTELRLFLDEWLENKTREQFQTAYQALEEYRIKEYSETVYYSIPQTIKDYFQREGNNAKLLQKIVSEWTLSMAPITPHLAEENWHVLLKQKTLVSTQIWKPDSKPVNPSVLQAENMINRLCEDIEKIKSLAKIAKPKSITFYPSPKWKWNLLKTVLDTNTDKPDFKKTIGLIMQKTEFKSRGNEIPQLIQKILNDVGSLREIVSVDEVKVLTQEQKFFEKKFGCTIKIEAESANPKAGKSFPQKPAIQIE